MHEVVAQEADLILESERSNSGQAENLIDRLINSLNKSGVAYCHWKSNYALSRSLAGEIDLDLLVERADLSLTVTILATRKFKSATVNWGIQDPGIYHYYGFDPVTGRLVHVHLFTQVLTGESFIKSHLLPLERMLLEHTTFNGKIRTPSKSAELVLFVLRNYIKYASLLDLFYQVRNKNEVTEELQWLENKINLGESLTFLRQYCPVISANLFLTCLDQLRQKGHLSKRIILSRKVRKYLAPYARYSRFKRMLAYTRLMWMYSLQRIRKNKKNKRLSSGGLIIAFVGPEATGKSTLVSGSTGWLKEVFAVKSFHAGKPGSSWLTYPLNIFLPLIRKLMPGLRLSRLEGHTTGNKEEKHDGSKKKPDNSFIYALRSVSLAWDRRQLLIKARRLAANGELVICDRYPSTIMGAMDSARLHKISGAHGIRGSVYNYLVDLEKRFYQQIPPPDLVLQLTVSMEIAIKRNQERIKRGKESTAYLASRHRLNKQWQGSGKTVVCNIDTDQPLEETINLVKKTIWEML